MKTSLKQRIVSISGIFFSLVMLVSSCVKCRHCEREDLLDETTTIQRRMNSEYLVVLATCRLFDDKSVSAKNSFQNMGKAPYLNITKLNADEDPLFIKYEFDFIKINEATHFVAESIDFPFLNEICGNGEIEVFLTSFDTFVYADDTKDKNNLKHYVGDHLIVFRGEWGMYSCMANSASFRYIDVHSYDDKDVSIYHITQYSSHKRFGENSIDKDFKPPIYHFYVETINDVTSFACGVADVVVGLPPVTLLDWKVLEGGDVVSSEELFSTEELSVMPETSQQCVITGVGDDYFLVSGKYHLGKIFFDEYTLFFIEEQPVKSTDFEKGDAITVTFNQLYKKYNPKVVLANKIVKN